MPLEWFPRRSGNIAAQIWRCAQGRECFIILLVRVAVLVKQVPIAEALSLRADGRLQRDHLELEMNAFCRRAVAHGVALARASGGSSTVLTLGPPAAVDVLREAIAWGADAGVHITGLEFAGSDTLATARALAAALRRTGPYDLVLTGRNAVDADTGQVGPAVAQYLELPFLGAATSAEVVGSTVRAQLEREDGWWVAEADLPAVMSCGERLCAPCKMPPEARAAVAEDRICTLSAAELGPGPWGEAGSATVVGAVRVLEVSRRQHTLHGPVRLQVAQALDLLRRSAALAAVSAPSLPSVVGESSARLTSRHLGEVGSGGDAPARRTGRRIVAVLLDPQRLQLAQELVGEATRLARTLGGAVVAIACAPIADDLVGSWGAGHLLRLLGPGSAEGVAATVGAWCAATSPWALLAPGTMWGREVAARLAVILQAGLTGDAVELAVDHESLICWKPAFGGRLVASVTATSAVQMATVRPGVLPVPEPGSRVALHQDLPIIGPSQVRVLEEVREDDIEALLRAPVVVGVGTGVAPDEYPLLDPLVGALGAEIAATRRVTDRGWLPRSRQVGLTGISIRPRLYLAIGLSGKFNHMIGVRGAGCVLAVNSDPQAPVFESADIGIVGDWREVVSQLSEQLAQTDNPLDHLAGEPFSTSIPGHGQPPPASKS